MEAKKKLWMSAVHVSLFRVGIVIYSVTQKDYYFRVRLKTLIFNRPKLVLEWSDSLVYARSESLVRFGRIDLIFLEVLLSPIKLYYNAGP